MTYLLAYPSCEQRLEEQPAGSIMTFANSLNISWAAPGGTSGDGGVMGMAYFPTSGYRKQHLEEQPTD